MKIKEETFLQYQNELLDARNLKILTKYEDYFGATFPIEVQCINCNSIFKRRIHNIRHGKIDCIICTPYETSSETKEKLRLANIGRKQTAEHIEKVRLANIGKKHSIEHKNKISETMMGHSVSNEAKEKMKQAALKRWSDSFFKQKMSKASSRKKKVERIDPLSGIVVEYSSIIEASRNTGINRTSIGYVCNERSRTAGGFYWSYINE